MKYCENCGQQLPDSAKFCGRCGAEQSVLMINNEIEKTAISEDIKQYKKCPFCAEKIRKEAILCRFCQRRLDVNGTEVEVQKSPCNDGIALSKILYILLSVLVKAAVIIMMFMPVLNLSLDFGFGYNFSGSNADMMFDVFTGFKAGDFIEEITKFADNGFTGNNLIIGLRVASGIFVVLIIAAIIKFAFEIYECVTASMKNKKFYSFGVAPLVIFAVGVAASWCYIAVYLSNSGIEIVTVSLSPTAVTLIVLTVLQILLNCLVYDKLVFKAEKKTSKKQEQDTVWACLWCGYVNQISNDVCQHCYRSRETNKIRNTKRSEWLCANCFNENKPSADRCEYCGSLKPSLRSKDAGEVNIGSTTWFCKCCLTYNSQLRTSCKECGTKREDSEELWICASCLKLNHNSVNCCDNCGKENPSVLLAKQTDNE